MGLTYPHDLEAWRGWQVRHQPLPRRLRRAMSRSGHATPSVTVTQHGGRARILVALDSRSPTSRLALLDPAALVHEQGVALLEAGRGSTDSPRVGPGGLGHEPALDDVRVVVALGHYLDVGGLAHAFARERGLPFVVVQHGLLTPLMAPLPEGCHLLAWTEADAAFWAAGRPDVTTHVVGSQLLWQASRHPAEPPAPGSAPVFLGQLHAAELSRWQVARATEKFCRAYGATYRPHPAETDKLSRIQHAWWRRRGIVVDEGGVPLAELSAPVVSVFSTGVLESAARGLPAWVSFADPPPWLQEFWRRYDLRPWGGPPTPAPPPPSVEPARAIARFLQEDL